MRTIRHNLTHAPPRAGRAEWSGCWCAGRVGGDRRQSHECEVVRPHHPHSIEGPPHGYRGSPAAPYDCQAASSSRRSQRAHLGHLDRIVVDKDEYVRHGANIEGMQKLRPAFVRDGGTVTAANASGINDGAAGVLVMSADEAEKRGITPMAGIASYATAGLDPSIMGVGPIHASRKALEKAGWKAEDLDLVEANEAFAAQACAVNKDMGWDPAIVNVNGGAIAIGHPIGASGARVLNTLLFEMQKRDAKKGLATLCIGGGMGVALCVER